MENKNRRGAHRVALRRFDLMGIVDGLVARTAVVHATPNATNAIATWAEIVASAVSTRSRVVVRIA